MLKSRLLLSGFVTTLLMASLYVFQPGFLYFMESKVYDVIFSSVYSKKHSGLVAIVDIDEEGLEHYGQWPWPRYRVGLLVEKIRRAGAAAIALDIVFAEADRTSPIVLHRSLKDDLGIELTFTGLPPGLEDNDTVLADMLRKGPNVLGYYFRVNDPEGGSQAPPTRLGGADAVGGGRTMFSPAPLKSAILTTPDSQTIDQALFVADDVVGNIEVLGQAAPASGFINVGTDRDGIVRRAPLLICLAGRVYPSLALSAVLQATGAETPALRLTSGGVESLRLAGRTIPLDAKGRMLLHYRGGRRTIPTLSVKDVLQDRLQPDALDGKIVFVGTSAAGLMDIRSTPLDPFFPGVEAQATVADTILKGDFLRRPDWAPGLELGLVLGMGVVSTLLLMGLQGIQPLFPLALLGLSSWMGAQTLFARQGLYLSPLMPLLTLVANFGILSFLKFWGEEREKRRIRTSFEHYLSPEVISRVIRNPALLKLGGEKKDMTIMFLDIRNFTTLSECLEPQELVAFMNEFHSAMTEVILEHGGTLDKYIGDAIMAFFGAPVDRADHALAGCRTALAMMERLYECRRDWRFPGFSRIEIGIGLSSGDMVVGNMGSLKRLSYTVMGDHVNLASRLEGLTKVYGVKILISQSTHAGIEGVVTCREIDRVKVKGKSKSVAIYEPFTKDYFSDGEFAFIPPFEEGLRAYRGRRFDEAITCFEDALRIKPQDNPSILYIDRCRKLKATPPPEDWDGVWTMTRK
jgi:adenylate cyclase